MNLLNFNITKLVLGLNGGYISLPTYYASASTCTPSKLSFVLSAKGVVVLGV